MILDYIDNLELSDNELEKHIYAQNALARLSEGLNWINRELVKYELIAKQQAKKENIQIAVAGGILDNRPLGKISCAFQWYAVSICNYAQLVGWLIYKDKDMVKNYTSRIMPKITKYRNKVAAHFAFADPRKEDNEATLTASVITNIIYYEGHFYAGTISPSTLKGKEINKSILEPWSITIAHQHLSKRFWPNGFLKSYQAIMIPPKDTVEIIVDKKNPL